MRTFIFDAETGALPEVEVASLVPPFDPAEVKTGNLKDPEKVAAKIVEAEANHRRDFLNRAALDPLTGRVVAIGLLDTAKGSFTVLGDSRDDEATILGRFWDSTKGEMGRINQMIGFNTHLFDLPFLIKRSWKYGLKIPFGIRKGRYWGDEMLDLRDAWQLGDRQSRGSLDSIARHLGVGAKNGHGADFAKLWETDRTKAVEYLRKDVELTARVAAALGFIQ